MHFSSITTIFFFVTLGLAHYDTGPRMKYWNPTAAQLTNSWSLSPATNGSSIQAMATIRIQISDLCGFGIIELGDVDPSSDEFDSPLSLTSCMSSVNAEIRYPPCPSFSEAHIIPSPSHQASPTSNPNATAGPTPQPSVTPVSLTSSVDQGLFTGSGAVVGPGLLSISVLFTAVVFWWLWSFYGEASLISCL
jgi:hypothetical protein